FPAILLYLAARGRTLKEAQANVSLVFLVVGFLPVFGLFMQWREPDWITAVPVAGQYSLLRIALRGEGLPALQLLLSYAAPIAIALIALAGLTRLFSRDSILSSR